MMRERGRERECERGRMKESEFVCECVSLRARVCMYAYDCADVRVYRRQVAERNIINIVTVML